MLLTKLMIFLTRLPVKRRDERKRIDRLIFSPFFFAVNRPHRKKGPHNEKCSHVQKVTKWVHFWILSPHPIIGDKTPNFFCCWHKCFYMLSIHGYILFGKWLFADIAVAVAWRTFWLFGYTHTLNIVNIYKYGFQWKENHKQ